jgi:sirohydrochlorin ferrochelatase
MTFSENPITNIILLAHGSPDSRSATRMEEFAEVISNRLGIATHSAYLGHNSPSLQDVASKIQDPDALVVPMLLTTAFHARFDVPKATKISGLHNVLPPIGHPAQVLQELIRQAGNPVLIVAVGTSSVSAQAVFEVAVQSASSVTGIRADHAYVTGKKDLIGAKFIDFVCDGGGSVIPWMFAEGKLMDRILVEATSRNLTVEGNGLCQENIFIDHMVRVISRRTSTDQFVRQA